MKFGLEPVDHIPPRPRIDLHGPRPSQANVEHAGFSFSPVECDRIWKLVKGAAEGTNIRTIAEPAK